MMKSSIVVGQLSQAVGTHEAQQIVHFNMIYHINYTKQCDLSYFNDKIKIKTQLVLILEFTYIVRIAYATPSRASNSQRQ
jgi:hypothetical protein